jgi:hypothetical protein
MVGRTAVLIPSRNRPGQLEETIQSVRDTAEFADVLVYIDDDQRELYSSLVADEVRKTDGRTIFHYGPRIDTVASLNALVEWHPDYTAYGVMTDNSVMTSSGWDIYLQEVLDYFPGRLGVVSPGHNCGHYVDQPFVSREWVDVVGWYAYPKFIHYAWPLLTGVIGGQTGICHCPDNKFGISHDYIPGYWEDKYVADCKTLYAALATTVFEKVGAIQAAMRKALEQGEKK